MKKIQIISSAFLAAFALMAFGVVNARGQNEPVKWTLMLDSRQASFKPGDTLKLTIQADIRPPWHLYSTTKIENGPIATSILLSPGQPFEQVGELVEPAPIIEFDRNFNTDTEFHVGSAKFSMTVRVMPAFGAGNNKIAVQSRYQSCTSEMCLPPKVEKLEIEVPTSAVSSNSATAAATKEISTRTLSTSSRASAVPDFDFVDFEGKPRKFSEFKGKVVLIDFWATWCGPCLADISKLKKLYERYRADGFEILGMNAETIGDSDSSDPEFAKEAEVRARQIVKTRGAIWNHANSASSLPIATKVFAVEHLPTKILIGRDGKVIARIGEKDDTEKIVTDAMSSK